MRLTRKHVQELINTLDEVRDEVFRGRRRKYPYGEWERKRTLVMERLGRLQDYVRRAVQPIHMEDGGRGRPGKLDLERKVHLFLLARLLGRSNRGMEEAMELFRPLFGTSLSYKYVERLYSDRGVRLALHNLFMLLVKDERTTGHLAGDRTGYSIKVENLYSKEPRKNGVKYLYFFSLIDLGTGMYVGCGHSRKSEMDAFQMAVSMLQRMELTIKSIRLDRYYSSRKVIERFGRDVSVFLIPKRNLARVGMAWLRILRKAMDSPVTFLSEYFLRNVSESGFSSDKRRFGRVIQQRRHDRQGFALFTKALLHNLYALRIGHY